MKRSKESRSKGPKHSRNKNTQLIPGFTNRPSTYKQQRFTVALHANPYILSTTVTTGVIAQEIPISLFTNVGGFASRFGNTFDEYRIERATVLAEPVSFVNGLAAVWFAEYSLGTPTYFEANQRDVKLIKLNNQVLRQNSLSWSNRDYTDAAWTPIANSVNPAYFYVYTDATNYAAPIAATQALYIRLSYIVEFRGLKST